MSAQLSAHVREEIDRWVAKFPPDRKRSAVISALHAAQHENNGFLTHDIMDAVAAYLGLAPILVYEVATFYSMFETKPVGRHHISVCTNISCMLRGSDAIVERIEKKLGIKTGESAHELRVEFHPVRSLEARASVDTRELPQARRLRGVGEDTARADSARKDH